MRHVLEKRAEQKREISLAQWSYSERFKPGVTRKEVEDYFRVRNIAFQQMCCKRQTKTCRGEHPKVLLLNEARFGGHHYPPSGVFQPEADSADLVGRVPLLITVTLARHSSSRCSILDVVRSRMDMGTLVYRQWPCISLRFVSQLVDSVPWACKCSLLSPHSQSFSRAASGRLMRLGRRAKGDE